MKEYLFLDSHGMLYHIRVDKDNKIIRSTFTRDLYRIVGNHVEVFHRYNDEEAIFAQYKLHRIKPEYLLEVLK